MFLDFFEGFSLRFRQEERRRDEINHRAAGEDEEHGGVAMPADRGQKEGGDGGGDGLVDQQRDAHAVGADARGHELGERQPDTDARTDGEEAHEHEGAEGGEPAVPGAGHGRDEGVPVADIGCGLFAIYGVLSAYIGAKNTGKGQYIDASLFDTALAFSIWDISQYWGTGEPPVPLGTANRMSAPYQAVKAKDGYFVMGATSQKLWKQLCNLLDRPALIDDPRFATVSLRLANRPELIAELEQSFATRNCASWIDEMLAVGIPAGPILTYPEAFESEHGRNRQMRIEIDHPIEGKVPNIGFPVKFSGTPAQVRLPPPLLGEHTAAVLAELGFDAGQQAELEAEGAFSA